MLEHNAYAFHKVHFQDILPAALHQTSCGSVLQSLASVSQNMLQNLPVLVYDGGDRQQCCQSVPHGQTCVAIFAVDQTVTMRGCAQTARIPKEAKPG